MEHAAARGGKTGADRIAAAKRELRSRVLADREAVDAARRPAAAAAVAGRLAALPPVAAARCVFCFVPFGSEIDTRPFIEERLQAGVVVVVPRVLAAHEMEAVPVTDLAGDLEPGHFGIPEPVATLAAVSPTAIDVAVVPASVFDESGYRVGYGGGFYDTFLGRMRPDAFTVGVAFDLQVVDEVPRDAHDRAVSLVVTERRVVVPGDPA